MRKVLYLLCFAMLFVQLGCGAGAKSQVKKGQIRQTIEGASVKKKYIETIGIGAADATLQNTTQRKATSRNAAIVAAQYEMISIIKGIQMEGGITVEKAMETDSKLSTTVNAFVKAAQVIKTEWTDDDGCVVTLRLNKKDLEEEISSKLK